MTMACCHNRKFWGF